MKRDTTRLAEREFDLLVIGGGMFGACIAWCATLRGYSVALVDKGDFGNATSSNHYKFIHGGIRYLQHADLVRMRESSRERSALIRIAPHLAYPMPIVLPTYGHGRKGRLIMQAGMTAYDMLTMDRNRGIADPHRRTPNGTVLSRDEVIGMFPGVPRTGLTGAAVFHDGQMYNPSRLVLAFIRSAVDRGAVVANYAAVEQLTRTGDRLTGCVIRDNQGDRTIEVRARTVVNAAGPWASELLLNGMGLELRPRPSFSRDLAFVVDRSVCPTHALGCQSTTHDTDALLDRGGRHLFLVPWRNRTLVGVWHRYSEASPDRLSIAEEELSSFLAEINSAYSGLDLKRQDIRMINTGLILFGSAEEQRSGSNHSFAKRSLIVDHASQGVNNLITVVGARATVARGVAEKVMNLVDRKHERRGETESSAWTTVHGGEFSSFGKLVQEIGLHLRGASTDALNSIAHNYGSAYGEILGCVHKEDGLDLIDGTNVLKAEITHAVRHEMATSLADIVFRRTELGTAGDPGDPAIEQVAAIAAREFGWDDRIREREIASTRDVLDSRGPWQFVASTEQLPRGE